MDNYLTVKQAADILGVSESTIRNFLNKRNYFNGKKFGKQYRIEKESFENYIKTSNIEKIDLEGKDTRKKDCIQMAGS